MPQASCNHLFTACSCIRVYSSLKLLTLRAWSVRTDLGSELTGASQPRRVLFRMYLSSGSNAHNAPSSVYVTDEETDQVDRDGMDREECILRRCSCHLASSRSRGSDSSQKRGKGDARSRAVARSRGRSWRGRSSHQRLEPLPHIQ